MKYEYQRLKKDAVYRKNLDALIRHEELDDKRTGRSDKDKRLRR